MPAPRLRRRALTLTAAVAATAGLAFGAAAVPAVAAPAPAAASASSAAAFRHAMADLPLGSDARDAAASTLDRLETGAAVSSRSASRSATGTSIPSTLQTTTTSPSNIVAAPATNVPPTLVNSNANQDSTAARASAGGVLYGIGSGEGFTSSSLERWTSAGWKRVAGQPSRFVLDVAAVGDTLYVATWSWTSKDYDGTTTFWTYNGTSFTRLASLAGSQNIRTAGSTVYVLGSTFDGVTYRTLVGTQLSAPLASTRLLFDTAELDGDLYGFVTNSSLTGSALYRFSPGAPPVTNAAQPAAAGAKATASIPAPALTRVATAPLGLFGTELDGTLYYGGIDLAANTTEVYAFDGTDAPTVVDTGISSYGSTVPLTGAIDHDLYVSAKPGRTQHLYRTADGTATDVGAIPTGVTFSFGTSTVDGTLLGNGLAYDLNTWVYDPAADATTARTITSATPAITGTPTVGTAVVADVGDWSPTATMAYQWYSTSTAGTRVAIAGATKAYHTVLPNELGKTLTLTVVGGGTGFAPVTQTSAPSAVVKAGTIVVKPVISGTMKAGTTLTALDRGTAPSSAKRTYRWYRDGKPLAGATKSTYRVTSGDVGHKITVGVHASATAYTAASAKSPARTATR